MLPCNNDGETVSARGPDRPSPKLYPTEKTDTK